MICLQEVDQDFMRSIWKIELERLGYTVHFAIKRGKAVHGLLIAYKSDLFSEVCYHEVHMDMMGTIARDPIVR